MATPRPAPDRPGVAPGSREGEPDVAAVDDPAAESAEESAAEGRALGTIGAGAVTSPPKRRRGEGLLFWMAVAWLGIVVFCAVFAGLLPLPSPILPNVSENLSPPGTNGILGTDGLGRDTLSRLAHGARVSLVISLSAVTIGMVVGGTLGMTVGYFRGRFERVAMSVIDVILAFPGLVLLLVLLAYVGRSLTVISLVVGFLSIPIYTRVARANTLAVAQREFVRSAGTMGARHGRILFREILPNVILPVAAFGLVAMGVIIVLEGSLAFLGLSVEPPDPTWGGMIFDGQRYLDEAAYVAAIPSVAMFLTVLALNFVGDSLRSRFDVKESKL